MHVSDKNTPAVDHEEVVEAEVDEIERQGSDFSSVSDEMAGDVVTLVILDEIPQLTKARTNSLHPDIAARLHIWIP